MFLLENKNSIHLDINIDVFKVLHPLPPTIYFDLVDLLVINIVLQTSYRSLPVKPISEISAYSFQNYTFFSSKTIHNGTVSPNILTSSSNGNDLELIDLIIYLLTIAYQNQQHTPSKHTCQIVATSVSPEPPPPPSLIYLPKSTRSRAFFLSQNHQCDPKLSHTHQSPSISQHMALLATPHRRLCHSTEAWELGYCREICNCKLMYVVLENVVSIMNPKIILPPYFLNNWCFKFWFCIEMIDVVEYN